MCCEWRGDWIWTQVVLFIQTWISFRHDALFSNVWSLSFTAYQRFSFFLFSVPFFIIESVSIENDGTQIPNIESCDRGWGITLGRCFNLTRWYFKKIPFLRAPRLTSSSAFFLNSRFFFPIIEFLERWHNTNSDNRFRSTWALPLLDDVAATIPKPFYCRSSTLLLNLDPQPWTITI